MRLCRILLITIVICVGLVALSLGLRSWFTPAALVHLSFPGDYEYEGRTMFMMRGDGHVSVELPLGVQVVRFTRKGHLYATVIDVQGGGEIYETLTEDDIHLVKVFKELRMD